MCDLTALGDEALLAHRRGLVETAATYKSEVSRNRHALHRVKDKIATVDGECRRRGLITTTQGEEGVLLHGRR